jgi:hypothetical protein
MADAPAQRRGDRRIERVLGIGLPHPYVRDGLWIRSLPFVVAVALAVALEPLAAVPGQSILDGDGLATFGVALALMLIVGAAVVWLPWDRVPRWTAVMAPLGYLAIVALLRDEAGGSTSGYSILVLIPVIWLALYGTRAEVIACLVAVALVFLVPIVAVGAPKYPSGEVRRTILTVLVATSLGLGDSRAIVIAATMPPPPGIERSSTATSGAEPRAISIASWVSTATPAVFRSGWLSMIARRNSRTSGSSSAIRTFSGPAGSSLLGAPATSSSSRSWARRLSSARISASISARPRASAYPAVIGVNYAARSTAS